MRKDIERIKNEIENLIHFVSIDNLEKVMILEDSIMDFSKTISWEDFKNNEDCIEETVSHLHFQNKEAEHWTKLFLFYALIKNNDISAKTKETIEKSLRNLSLGKMISHEKKLYFDIKKIETRILLFNRTIKPLDSFYLIEYLKKNSFLLNRLSHISSLPQIQRKKYFTYIGIGELYSMSECPKEANGYYNKALKEYDIYKNECFNQEDYLFLFNHLKENRI